VEGGIYIYTATPMGSSFFEGLKLAIVVVSHLDPALSITGTGEGLAL
jgi:hypothetical protein